MREHKSNSCVITYNWQINVLYTEKKTQKKTPSRVSHHKVCSKSSEETTMNE